MQGFIMMGAQRVGMQRPDGMGADRYRERQRMKEASKPSPTPTHDVVAVDQQGEKLYVTESGYSHEEAQRLLEDVREHVEREGLPDNVMKFEIRERD